MRTDYTILALAALAIFLAGFILGVVATSIVALAGQHNRRQERFE